MILVLLFLAWVPDVSALGADEWAVREAESRRCDNPVSAALLPHAHSDPEVCHRVRFLRTKNLKYWNPEYVERVAHRHDFARWLDEYFVPGRSGLVLDDVYDDLAADPARVRLLHDHWPMPICEWPPIPWLIPLWEFRELCDYHWLRAPQPRAK